MNKQLVLEFWLESVLPGIREAVKCRNTDGFIKIIVDRADRDVMAGGRFVRDYFGYHDKYKSILENQIKQHTHDLSSDYLIKEICGQTNSWNKVGWVQKLVNMSL